MEGLKQLVRKQAVQRVWDQAEVQVGFLLEVQVATQVGFQARGLGRDQVWDQVKQDIVEVRWNG